jgi:hypothetical protein
MIGAILAKDYRRAIYELGRDEASGVGVVGQIAESAA